MKTKYHRRFFIIRNILVEDEGYLYSEKIILKYYGRNYVGRIGA